MMISDTACIIAVILLAIGILALQLLMAARRPGLTWILSLTASVIALVTGSVILDQASNSDWALINIGIISIISSLVWFLSINILLLFKAPLQGYSNTPWWKYLARGLVGIITSILFLAGLLIVFNILGLLLFVFIGVAIYRYWIAVRYNRALEIISTLTAAMRQNLPLPAALQAAALGQQGQTAWIFRNIAHWLTQGNSLAESICKGYPRCLPEIRMAIETAEKMNQLPQTLLSLEKDLANETDETKKIRPVQPWYPVIVLFFVVVLTMGLLIFIVPTFSGVLFEMSEGHEGLPAATQLLLNVSRTLMNWQAVLIIIGTFLCIYFVWSYYIFRTRVSYKPGLFLNFMDWIRWFVPVQGKLERNISTLRLVEILRPALNAGLSIPQAITAALSTKINNCYKNRVNRWLGLVERGDNIAQSARACGIGHSIAWALDDKINPGQAPVLLEMLEENCRHKHNYLGNIIRSIMWPLVIVALGAFVGFIVYAMFIPMVQIILIGVQNVNP
jgi:type II secretory pathway component PulF